MCDFSLQSTQSRPAKIGDKLTTRNFGNGTRGFAAPEDPTTAVCLLPGTELAFSKEVGFGSCRNVRVGRTTYRSDDGYLSPNQQRTAAYPS